jgi:hypothetical protein
MELEMWQWNPKKISPVREFFGTFANLPSLGGFWLTSALSPRHRSAHSVNTQEQKLSRGS